MKNTENSNGSAVGSTDLFFFMEYRKHDWLNTNTMQSEHGIQAKHPKTEKWLHCCEGSKPLIYKTEAERDAKLRDLRKNDKGQKRP